MKLSETRRQIPTAAAAHPLRLTVPPAELPVAAREAVQEILLAKGLTEAVETDTDEQETRATEAHGQHRRGAGGRLRGLGGRRRSARAARSCAAARRPGSHNLGHAGPAQDRPHRLPLAAPALCEGAAAAPAIASAIIVAGYPTAPSILCGVLKIVYDLMLLRAFRHIRPPEEQVART